MTRPYSQSDDDQNILTWPSSYLFDIRFWILLSVINISGNLLFQIHIDSRPALITVFCITVIYLKEKKSFPIHEFKFIVIYTIILLVPSIYLGSLFSWLSFTHIEIKIIIGILITVILGKDFSGYYICIISILSIISLLCFFTNCLGFILPYLPVDSTTLDSGNIYRVSSVIYTQLYNLTDPGRDFSLRNSGLFWEPGAFQGYLNLAIAILIFSNTQRTRKWWSIIVLFSITVLTTFSTGGYIVLTVLWLYLILTIDIKSRFIRYILLGLILVVIALMFTQFAFLYSKLITDKSRLGMDFGELGSDIRLLFGYSYSDASFSQSAFKTASGLFNTLKYSGIIGFIVFLAKLFWVKNVSSKSIMWGLIISLILMNEPFLTVGPFWWSTLFLWNYLPNVNPCKSIQRYD